MKLRVAEVALIRMQFHQAAGSKMRPELVPLDPDDEDFVAAPISSQPRSSEFDLVRIAATLRFFNGDSFTGSDSFVGTSANLGVNVA